MAPEKQPEMGLGMKLVSIMGDIGTIEKGGWNANQKYPFVQEQDIANAVRPLLAKYKVLIHQTLKLWEQVGPVTRAEYTFQFIDAETGETWPSTDVLVFGYDGGDKGPNKCSTVANKFFLLRAFEIGAGTKEDSEADDKTDKAVAAEAAKAGPRIARGNQAGVGRGGKSSLATKAQVSEVARLVRELKLDLDDFVSIASRITETKPTEDQTGSQWLSTMTGSQVASIIEVLSGMAPGPVDSDVETVDNDAEEPAETAEDVESGPLAVV